MKLIVKELAVSDRRINLSALTTPKEGKEMGRNSRKRGGTFWDIPKTLVRECDSLAW